VFLRALRSSEAPQLYRMAYCAEYPDETAFSWTSFTPPGARTTPGWSGSAAESFDRLVELAAAIVDPQKRAALYSEAEKILVEDQAIIMPMYTTHAWPASSHTCRAPMRPWAMDHIDQWKVLPH